MSNEPQNQPLPQKSDSLLNRLSKAVRHNWKIKLLSLLIAITIWGALMSGDATLTREKTFEQVPLSITGTDSLQRSGLVVVSGLDQVEPLRMRVDVPQRAYDTVTASNYSVRVDVSRITTVGEQKIPILTLSTSTYGNVTWLSVNELTVKVEEYITRRRVPVRVVQTGQVPDGFYTASISADPSNVIISGPRSLVEQIDVVLAQIDLSVIDSSAGVQYTAVPFRLMNQAGEEIKSNLISVTSENILLDTILVEQSVFPTKAVDVNLTGSTKGMVKDGYQIVSIKADPAQILIAGNLQDIDGVKLLDLTSTIDVNDMTETVIRALRVEKPVGVTFMSDSAVYVTVEILPVAPGEEE